MFCYTLFRCYDWNMFVNIFLIIYFVKHSMYYEWDEKRKKMISWNVKNKYLRIQPILVSCICNFLCFTWPIETACSHPPYNPRESCYQTKKCCRDWFENYNPPQGEPWMNEGWSKWEKEIIMKGRYFWFIFCSDCSDQLMTKIVLSGSGRRNLLISPPRIHMHCVKFHNS